MSLPSFGVRGFTAVPLAALWRSVGHRCTPVAHSPIFINRRGCASTPMKFVFSDEEQVAAHQQIVQEFTCGVDLFIHEEEPQSDAMINYMDVQKTGTVPPWDNMFPKSERRVMVRLKAGAEKLEPGVAAAMSTMERYQSMHEIAELKASSLRDYMRTLPPDILRHELVLPRLCRLLLSCHTPELITMQPVLRSDEERQAASRRLPDLPAATRELGRVLGMQARPVHGDVAIYLNCLAACESAELCEAEMRRLHATVDFARARHYASVAHAYAQQARLQDVLRLYREAKLRSAEDGMVGNVHRDPMHLCYHSHPGIFAAFLMLFRRLDEQQGVSSPYPVESVAQVMTNVPVARQPNRMDVGPGGGGGGGGGAQGGRAAMPDVSRHHGLRPREAMSVASQAVVDFDYGIKPPPLAIKSDSNTVDWDTKNELDFSSSDVRRDFFFKELLFDTILTKTDQNDLSAEALARYFAGSFDVRLTALSPKGVCDTCGTQLVRDSLTVKEMVELNKDATDSFRPLFRHFQTGVEEAMMRGTYDCVLDVSNIVLAGDVLNSCQQPPLEELQYCWKLLSEAGYQDPLLVISRSGSLRRELIPTVASVFPCLVINRGPRFLDDYVSLALAMHAVSSGRNCILVTNDLHLDKTVCIPAKHRDNFQRFVKTHRVGYVPTLDGRSRYLQCGPRVRPFVRHIAPDSFHLYAGLTGLSNTYEDQFVCLRRTTPSAKV